MSTKQRMNKTVLERNMSMKVKCLLFFISATFLVACEDSDLIEYSNLSKNQISTQAVYSPTKYSKQNGDVLVKRSLPTTMAKQVPNTCVTSIMEYANNKVFGGTVNEGTYILYYIQTYNSDPLTDGVSLNNIEPFVSHFFNTKMFTDYKSAIDAKHPVMTDVKSQIENSTHNVLCVGYNSKTGAAIYMDPELASMYTVAAGYFLQHYNIELTGVK